MAFTTTTPNKPKTPAFTRYSWIILWVVFLASIASSFNQQKIPPILPLVMDDLKMSLSLAGGLMSVFALTGVFLALPAGFIIQRFGTKITGLVSLSSLLVGALLGGLSSSPGALLISRVIEGIGMGLIAVVAPAMIALWFPGERQGTPLGIWSTWIPVGAISSALFAPWLATRFGWRSVWWLGAGLALVALILYSLLVRQPSRSPDYASAIGALRLRKAFTNRGIWLLAASYACFNISLLSLATFLPTYLTEIRGDPLSQAAIIVNIPSLVIIFSAPAAGWLSDQLGTRKWIYSFGYLGLAAIIVLPLYLTGTAIIVYMLVQGLFIGAIPTATFAAAPEVMEDSRLAGIAMAIVMLGQNIGMVIGPFLFGMLVPVIGWIPAAFCLIPVMLLGFIFGWLVKVR